MHRHWSGWLTLKIFTQWFYPLNKSGIVTDRYFCTMKYEVLFNIVKIPSGCDVLYCMQFLRVERRVQKKSNVINRKFNGLAHDYF